MNGDHGADSTAVEREILDSLGLPKEAIPLFLNHIEEFCRTHGGERHYAELLKLVAHYQGTLEQR